MYLTVFRQHSNIFEVEYTQFEICLLVIVSFLIISLFNDFNQNKLGINKNSENRKKKDTLVDEVKPIADKDFFYVCEQTQTETVIEYVKVIDHNSASPKLTRKKLIKKPNFESEI